MAASKRRSMEDFLAEQRTIEDPLADDVRPETGAGSGPEQPGQAGTQSAAAGIIQAAAVPEPHSPIGHGQLSAKEEADLATCEAALDNLRMAFWAAGKALQAVRDGRLYRGSHDTFESYCEDRWDMSARQAYRLISSWPLAERLSPVGPALTESQVRELLPVADRHGQDAAAVVYQTVTDTDGVRVTAAILREVVGILPADSFDSDEAVRQIREYLNGNRKPPEPPPADPVKVFTAASAKLVTALRRVADTDIVQAARTADPDLVRKTVADIRTELDKIDPDADT